VKIRRTVYLLHPAVHRITKFFPDLPARKGDHVLVEGVQGIRRCRVISDPKVEWSKEPEPDDTYRWWLRGPIRVVVDPGQIEQEATAEGVFV
jgi:hypothetical protein